MAGLERPMGRCFAVSSLGAAMAYRGRRSAVSSCGAASAYW